MLSNDATHTTKESLGRHLSRLPDGGFEIICGFGIVDPEEIATTITLACAGLVTGVSAANLIIKDEQFDEEISMLWDEWKKITSKDGSGVPIE